MFSAFEKKTSTQWNTLYTPREGFEQSVVVHRWQLVERIDGVHCHDFRLIGSRANSMQGPRIPVPIAVESLDQGMSWHMERIDFEHPGT